MARNGAGTYQLPAGQPVVTGTTISSATHNTLANDLANALTTSIATDGQSVVTANIPFSGYKATGLGAATVNGDALRFENLSAISSGQQAQTSTYYTTGGTTTAYTLTPTPAITSLVAGQRFNVVFNAANTAVTSTLAISGLAATALKIYNTAGVKVDPPIGALAANLISDVIYDGTDYVVMDNPGPRNEPVNAQTGTTYTYLTGDKGKLVTHSNAAAIAGTLPQAGTSFPSGWWMDVQNRGVGTLTITPTTSTIDGVATLVLGTGDGVRVISDGTNYFTLRGSPLKKLTSGTAVATTSGSTIDFTSIPSWVTRITIALLGTSVTGVDNPAIQIGTGGSPTTSGYKNESQFLGGTAQASTSSFTFGVNGGGPSNTYHGQVVITKVTGNSYVMSGTLAVLDGNAGVCVSGGSVTLAGTLDMVRLLITGGQTFDAGTVNVIYE
jgi:hypothetical protein